MSGFLLPYMFERDCATVDRCRWGLISVHARNQVVEKGSRERGDMWCKRGLWAYSDLRLTTFRQRYMYHAFLRARLPIPVESSDSSPTLILPYRKYRLHLLPWRTSFTRGTCSLHRRVSLQLSTLTGLMLRPSPRAARIECIMSLCIESMKHCSALF